jgi:transposase InsO family protein
LARLEVRQSLSRSGSCLDNAVAESFFAGLKTEIGMRSWTTRQAATRAVDHWIGAFYNNQRLHSTLGYRTPAEAHAQFAQVA